jgi:hypothetical protein
MRALIRSAFLRRFAAGFALGAVALTSIQLTVPASSAQQAPATSQY